MSNVLLVADFSLLTAGAAAFTLLFYSPAAIDSSWWIATGCCCNKADWAFSKVLFLLLFLLQWSIVEPVAALMRGGETKELFNIVWLDGSALLWHPEILAIKFETLSLKSWFLLLPHLVPLQFLSLRLTKELLEDYSTFFWNSTCSLEALDLWDDDCTPMSEDWLKYLWAWLLDGVAILALICLSIDRSFLLEFEHLSLR